MTAPRARWMVAGTVLLALVRRVTMHRVGVAIVLLALLPLTVWLRPLEASALLADALVMLIGHEMVRFATARESVRHSPATPA